MYDSVILQNGLNQLGIEPDNSQIAMLRLYIDEIELWNNRYKLVGSIGNQLIIRHILDSLSALTELKNLNFTSAADVGSGAGLPGIPLAIFLPDATFTLIERSSRRVAFLRNVISLLNFGKRVVIIESEVEKVTDKFDLILFRAFRNLTDYYRILKRLALSEGTMFAYKGKLENIKSEISNLGQIQVDIKSVIVPFLEEERNFCIFRV